MKLAAKGAWALAALWLVSCSVVLDPGGFVGPELDGGTSVDAATPSDGALADAAIADASSPVDGGQDGGCITCGGATCVDLATDPRHCGGCSVECTGFQGCRASTCSAPDLISFRSADMESVRGVAVSDDGRVCVTGEVGASADVYRLDDRIAALGSGDTDAFVACFEPDGSLAWTQFLAGPGIAVGRAIAMSASEVAVVGFYDQTVALGASSLPASNGGTDGFVARYSSAGLLLSAQRIGGTGDDQILGVAYRGARLCYGGQFRGTVRLPNGASTAEYTAIGGADAFVTCHTSPSMATSRSFGSPVFDSINSVAILGDEVAVAGSFDGPIAAFGGLTPVAAPDAFIAWLDDSLLPIAQARIGGSGADFVQGITPQPAGGVTAFGGCSGAGAVPTMPAPSDCPGGIDGFVATYDAAHRLVWGTVVGGPGFDSVLAGFVEPSGRVWVGGQFAGTLTLPGFGALAGTGGGDDGFVVHLSPGGAILSAQEWGGPSADRVLGAALDPARRAPVFVGEYQDRTTVGGVSIGGAGGYDGLIIRASGPL